VALFSSFWPSWERDQAGAVLTTETRALKIMGYLWTFAWISWSMRYAASYQYETGALNHYEPLEFSVINLVAGKITKLLGSVRS
jgi:hypothetical protein